VLGPLSLGQRPAGTPTAVIDTDSLTAEPLIDEPVASGGDSSAWTGAPADRDKDGEKPK
jgi:hypothetical protein